MILKIDPRDESKLPELLEKHKSISVIEIIYDPVTFFSFESPSQPKDVSSPKKAVVEAISDDLTLYHYDKVKGLTDLLERISKHFPGTLFSELDVSFGIVSITISLKKEK